MIYNNYVHICGNYFFNLLAQVPFLIEAWKRDFLTCVKWGILCGSSTSQLGTLGKVSALYYFFPTNDTFLSNSPILEILGNFLKNG